MSISTDYPSPVQVNGFTCRNCTDVDYAKKHIDPAHPKDGPYGIDAQSNPGGSDHGPSVKFGGALSGLANATQQSAATGPQTRLDISV